MQEELANRTSWSGGDHELVNFMSVVQFLVTSFILNDLKSIPSLTPGFTPLHNGTVDKVREQTSIA